MAAGIWDLEAQAEHTRLGLIHGVKKRLRPEHPVVEQLAPGGLSPPTKGFTALGVSPRCPPQSSLWTPEPPKGAFLSHRRNEDSPSHGIPHVPPPRPEAFYLCRSKPWPVVGANSCRGSRAGSEPRRPARPGPDFIPRSIRQLPCQRERSWGQLGQPLGHSSRACQRELASHTTPGSHPAGSPALPLATGVRGEPGPD